MRPKLILALLFPAICLAQSQKPAAASDQDRPANPFAGAKIFQKHCAACHGTDGRGHGPATVSQKRALPDLTLIAQRNGGKFPYQRVRDRIEGKKSAPPAHSDLSMPTWGPTFHQVEADQDWGEVRLDAITRHIESIQQK